VDDHLDELTAAGFVDAGVVWRDRHSAVIAGPATALTGAGADRTGPWLG
jgi:hypothetical protein